MAKLLERFRSGKRRAAKDDDFDTLRRDHQELIDALGAEAVQRPVTVASRTVTVAGASVDVEIVHRLGTVPTYVTLTLGPETSAQCALTWLSSDADRIAVRVLTADSGSVAIIAGLWS